MMEERSHVTGSMQYDLQLSSTSSGVGYFACLPRWKATFDGYLDYLRRCPLDEFMHKHLLDMICEVDEQTIRSILSVARGVDPIMEALVHEACLSNDKLAPLRSILSREEARALLPYSPLITLKSSLQEDQPLHRAWSALLKANLVEHQALPDPSAVGFPFPYPRETLVSGLRARVSAREAREDFLARSTRESSAMPTAEETAQKALDRLGAIGVAAGSEVRHGASLSPFGFYRKWHLKLQVRNGRHDYAVTGVQTSYGKGMTEAGARASYAMEMVERVSSFAGFGPEGVRGYEREYPLIHGSLSGLAESGRPVLDPNGLRLEVPYEEESLYWLEAQERTSTGFSPVLIPAQSVFLFCNLDEISLFSGLGSTGLASGNTMEQAKVSALLEVLERDCEATTLYDPDRCFCVEAADPLVASVLSDYAAKGVHVQFQDLTGPLGVPCWKSFVVSARSGIVKGAAAHLDGRKALLSALTETPYAYQGGLPTARAPEGLPVKRFEDLPDFTGGSVEADLEILESLLRANGFRVIYVDLTRKDLGIPVVKAIVPGMELLADFDEYSRISPRLFASYLERFGRL